MHGYNRAVFTAKVIRSVRSLSQLRNRDIVSWIRPLHLTLNVPDRSTCHMLLY